MGELQLLLLGLVAGVGAGYGAGRLLGATVPLVRDAAPAYVSGAAVLLLLLAVFGVMLGYLVQLFFEHWSVLLGALSSYLYVVTPLLKAED